MALVTANQFQLTPDITSALAGGTQIRGLREQQVAARSARARQEQVNPLAQQLVAGGQTLEEIQATQAQLAGLGPEGVAAIESAQGITAERFAQQDAATQQRLRSVTQAAAQINSLPDTQKLPALMRRREQLIAQGQPTNDTDEAIAAFESGDIQAGNQMLSGAVRLGEQLGILEPVTDPEFKRQIETQKLDLQKQTLDVRREEQKQRALDRDIAREDNQIKREALQQKLEESKRKSEQGKRDVQFEAQNAIGAVEDTLGTVDRLLTGEGLEKAAGVSSAFPTVPGSAAADFEAQLETLQSQAFLAQVEKMKGLGALSENEGKKLGAALGSLSLSMSDKALRSELDRIKGTLNKARDKLRVKFNVQPQEEQAPQTAQVGRFTVEVE